MSPRSLGKGQSSVTRHFIFLQLGEARLSPRVSGHDKGGVTGSSYTGLTMALKQGGVPEPWKPEGHLVCSLHLPDAASGYRWWKDVWSLG